MFSLLLAGFATLYFQIGATMGSHGALRNNRFFHSDVARVMLDMTNPQALHLRTNVHPLFVLFMQPLGVSLRTLFHSPLYAALTINSITGGLCVALTGLFLRTLGASSLRSILGALLLGLSACFLYFGSAPETFIFSCLSIILLFFCVARRPGQWRFFIPAGVFSFGVLTTNLAFVCITHWVSVLSRRTIFISCRKTAIVGFSVLVIAAALSFAQLAIWRNCVLFFLPEHLTGEARLRPITRACKRCCCGTPTC